MAGTSEGGKAAAKTNKLKYGPDFYIKIGKQGGESDQGNRSNRGFATMDRKKHIMLASKGGKISRKSKKL